MATIDQSIANKYNEIKSLPYAKNIIAEDVIERNFGYKIIRHQVASGRNSVIYKCETVKYREVYCIVKAYKLGKEKVKLSLKEETCQIMRFVSSKCPQVISTFDIFYTNEKIYLMSDWSSRGEVLINMQNRTIKLTEEVLRNWTLDMLNAITFLHNNGICHRNISPGCLLLTEEGRVKVGTLGDAVVYTKPDGTLIKQKWKNFSRTANWNQPPEVAKGKPYDPRRSDVWSLGATLYWFITKFHPIDYRSSSRLTKQLEHRLTYMRKVSRRCQDFVKKMLTYQPHSRPTIADAMQLEWISNPPSSTKSPREAENEFTTNEKNQDPGEAAGPEEVPEVELSVTKKEEPSTATPES